MSAQNPIVIKQFVPKDKAQNQQKVKRVRPKVPDEQRKRVRLACESCRTRKEGCDGHIPCQRCAREAIVCVPGTASTYSRMNQNERIERLQLVVRHALGIDSLTDEELRTISDSLGKRTSGNGRENNSQIESSLSTFSLELERKLGDKEKPNDSYGDGQDLQTDSTDDVITEFCNSSAPVPIRAKSFLHSVLVSQPSLEVANDLARVYFAKVQCNSFQVQETWTFEHLHLLYQPKAAYEKLDTPVVATLAMVMALGSQFSADLALEPIGALLYEHTSAIVPDLVQNSDFESIRACLLLATYLFPVDHSGKAYTYLGLALHMAMSRKMHQTCNNEVETRVWWTLYTFYQRARIFHGHPETLAYADVTVRRPRHDARLEPKHGISNFDNQVALIEITITLEKIAKEISSLRKQRSAIHMANLLALRRNLVDFQTQLPSVELTTDKARLRLDIHLYLFYWHARLYLGRPFLLESSSIDSEPSATVERAPAGRLFAQDAHDAAIQIMNLCQKIQIQIGLSQASYVTEFTSCRAAMLVLIAKAMTDKSQALSDTLAQGLHLIQDLSAGQSKASSETRVIAALQRAVARLHKRPMVAEATLTSCMPNEYTKEWEMLWQQQSPNYASNSVLNNDNNSDGTAEGPFGMDSVFDPLQYDAFDIGNANFNTQLEEFSLFPLDEIDLQFGFDSTD